MEYDFIDGWGIKTFTANVTENAKNGWKPVWSTLRINYDEKKRTQALCGYNREKLLMKLLVLLVSELKFILNYFNNTR